MHARVIALATASFVIVIPIARLTFDIFTRRAARTIPANHCLLVCGMGCPLRSTPWLHWVDRRSVARAVSWALSRAQGRCSSSGTSRGGAPSRRQGLLQIEIRRRLDCSEWRLRDYFPRLTSDRTKARERRFIDGELLFLLAHLRSDQSRSTRRCRLSFEDAGHGRKLRIPDGVVALGHVQQATGST